MPAGAAVLAATVPLAARAVALLPADSALYRVDVYDATGAGAWAVNEVEMVDAELFPDDHAAGVDVVEALARQVLRDATARVRAPAPDNGDGNDDDGAEGAPPPDWTAVRRALRAAFAAAPLARRVRGRRDAPNDTNERVAKKRKPVR